MEIHKYGRYNLITIPPTFFLIINHLNLKIAASVFCLKAESSRKLSELLSIDHLRKHVGDLLFVSVISLVDWVILRNKYLEY